MKSYTLLTPMARRRGTKAGNAERAKRLAGIREALGVSQYDMVPILNAAAERLGLPADYKYYTVSRIESGTISFEDAAVYLAVAPERLKTSWEWFVFGEQRKRVLIEDPRKPANGRSKGRRQA